MLAVEVELEPDKVKELVDVLEKLNRLVPGLIFTPPKPYEGILLFTVRGPKAESKEAQIFYIRDLSKEKVHV